MVELSYHLPGVHHVVIKEGRGKVGRSVFQGPLTAALLIVAACAVVGSMQVSRIGLKPAVRQ
jgi:hypothetical protein